MSESVCIDTALIKRCTSCGVEKSLQDFVKSKLGKLGRAARCKECASKAWRDNYKASQGRYQATAWKAKRTRQVKELGVIPDRCEVCGAKFFPGRHTGEQWDHNHATGKGRGWLCQGCNKALGSAGDNPLILSALAEYLKTKGAAPTRALIR